MRNLIVLVEPEEIVAHYRSLWRTDLFRESHDDVYGYIRHWVCRVAQLPRAFFEMDRPEVEHSHFTPMFNAIHAREYDNPYVHDLFVLHETVHQVGLAELFDPDTTWEAWTERIIRNEQETALESEVHVYQALPDLRSRTFPFTIWADRFLGIAPLPRRALFALRQRAMIDPWDDVERQMAVYPHQNRAWAEVWRRRWREPEAAMQRFVREAARDRRGAADRYRHWLLGETGMTTDRPYPFPDEAEEFARIFRANKDAGFTPDTGSRHAQAPTA
jgi:hypothetical protein